MWEGHIVPIMDGFSGHFGNRWARGGKDLGRSRPDVSAIQYGDRCAMTMIPVGYSQQINSMPRGWPSRQIPQTRGVLSPRIARIQWSERATLDYWIMGNTQTQTHTHTHTHKADSQNGLVD